MKLSWRDIVTTTVALAGGAVVYAKFYNYSWAGLASWRTPVTALLVAGILMFAFSAFKFTDLSVISVAEMVLGVVAIILAIIGIIGSSKFVFYSLAIILGVIWLINTARHALHSISGDETSTYHHQAPAH